ncbi:kinase-like domain-containing protein [Butyriboletus roseoflavus]|nr:kinase-like domain-containing protein [Butyriboletus roseoflavus]
MAPRLDDSKRNVVFIGETGTGKSSAINLLIETGTLASISNDSRPCTQVSNSYETTLKGTKYNLWDTRGLGEGRSFFQAIFKFGRSSEKDLKKFLKERHQRHEIDLLVFCVRGTRATAGSVEYYNKFCPITRRLVAPVVLVVIQSEKEKDIEDWWNRNSSDLKNLKMGFDDHVCITLARDCRLAESKKKLVELITKSRLWEPKETGSYFGSPVQKSTPPPPPRTGRVYSPFRPMNRGNAGGGGLDRRPSNHSGPSSTAPSARTSSYQTAIAESPRESVPSSPIVEPPTPCTATNFAKVPHIDTGLLRVSDPPQSTSEGTSSMRSSLHSVFNSSPQSSCTSPSEMHLQSCIDENEGYFSELPFKHSTAIVRRREAYATRRGAFGDVWECDLISGESSCLVAVKAVKIDTNKDLGSQEKKLRRELRVWGRLRHRNVVPLLGVVSGFGPLPSMVSPWFCNGSLSQYLAHRWMLSLSEKHRLLKDITAGLCYVHSQGVIHGDLHSDNVLIDEHGTACLTDFGLSLIKDFVGTSYLKSSICGGVQFADPALVQRVYSPQDNVFYPTKPCDVYSFGGLMLHILCGKKPYNGSSTPIFLTVLKGERPQIPTDNKHITQRHKSMIEMCWAHEETRRPSADALMRMLELPTSESSYIVLP